MNKFIKQFKAFFTFVLLQLLFCTAAFAACVNVDGGIQTQTLYAGQTIEIGTVSVQVIDSDLVVTYNTTGGWELTETHLWVGNNINDMPQTRKGSPKIGNFPYHSGDITGATNFVVTIPLATIGFSCPGDDGTFYVAAHAAVQLVDNNGDVVQTETAWGDGDRFVEKGMWGTFFAIVLSCDCGVTPPPPVKECETAFAYSGGTNPVDGDFTNSFLDIDEDNDTVGDFNRWGWSNGAIGIGSYNWDIYAGAGQSDISKGTLVGTLTVNYNADGTVDVSYDTNSPYYMDETHLYVGDEILPRNGNGDFTVAPGQYPTIHDELNEVTQDIYMFSGVSGDIYVVAHAVVCGFEL
jgi:hypothetical protein